MANYYQAVIVNSPKNVTLHFSVEKRIPTDHVLSRGEILGFLNGLKVRAFNTIEDRNVRSLPASYIRLRPSYNALDHHPSQILAANMFEVLTTYQEVLESKMWFSPVLLVPPPEPEAMDQTTQAVNDLRLEY